MKSRCLFFTALFLGLVLTYTCAQENKPASKKVVILIAEQNIEGPQRAWWASEIDLSVSESKIATRLIENGFQVLDPSVLSKTIEQNRAFRVIDLTEDDSVKLGSLSEADYVILGKTIASAGGNIPQSNMRSCFANVTAKVIRVKNGVVVAYLDASGNSAHMDTITGGKEALAKAAEELAAKIIVALNRDDRDGGK